MKILKKGYGFEVGQNFARATQDTPITLVPSEYAKPGCVIGYIAENPSSSLGFLKYGHDGKIRVHTLAGAIADQAEAIAS